MKSFEKIAGNEFYSSLLTKTGIKTPNGMLYVSEVEGFTDADLLNIKLLLGNEYIYDLSILSQASYDVRSLLVISDKIHGCLFRIVKLMDEWFMVLCTDDSPHTSYKCDQLSGLLDCLSNFFWEK